MIADRNPGVDWALYRQVGLQANVSTQVQVALEPYVPVHSFTCQDSVNQTQLSTISLTNSNLLVPGRYILVATDTFGQRSVSFNISIAGIWRYLVSSISAQCMYIFFLCFFSYQIGLCIILPFISPSPPILPLPSLSPTFLFIAQQ